MSVDQQFPNSRVVQTADGKIQGRRLICEGARQVDAFQGIPFAAPPLGELRFKKPQPPTRWNGVKETKAFSARAIQAPKYKHDYEVNGVPSEDCLYLNVFTPCWKPPSAGFPVMIFIHGGGFECGESRTYGDLNICENIVSRGVVFVTIQYRVGYLGFFTTGDSVCPGNVGLWDQTEALRWVQTNIAAFGGDKNNVTVVGQSAGGASADFLHLSPHSTGLFQKVICMAGSAECRWASKPSMPAQCRAKARRLGIMSTDSEELISELRKVPAETFGVNMITREKEDDGADFETVPYVDGDFFPESFEKLRAKAKPKPMMTGVTKEEGIFMKLFMKINQKTANRIVTAASQSANDKKQLARALSRRFEGLSKQSDEFGRAIANIASDYYFNAGILELCRKTVANQKEPVYLYTFEHWNPEALGMFLGLVPIEDVTHACELFYLFKHGLFGAIPEITDTELKVIDRFTTAFTNFAKFGNPNGSGKASVLPARWEPVSRDNCGRNYVFATENCFMREQFFEGRTAEFLRIVNEHRSDRQRSSL